MDTPLATADAWRARLDELSKTYQHMQDAPALFRPEYVRETWEALRVAQKNLSFWLSQVG